MNWLLLKARQTSGKVDTVINVDVNSRERYA